MSLFLQVVVEVHATLRLTLSITGASQASNKDDLKAVYQAEVLQMRCTACNKQQLPATMGNKPQ